MHVFSGRPWEGDRGEGGVYRRCMSLLVVLTLSDAQLFLYSAFSAVSLSSIFNSLSFSGLETGFEINISSCPEGRGKSKRRIEEEYFNALLFTFLFAFLF